MTIIEIFHMVTAIAVIVVSIIETIRHRRDFNRVVPLALSGLLAAVMVVVQLTDIMNITAVTGITLFNALLLAVQVVNANKKHP